MDMVKTIALLLAALALSLIVGIAALGQEIERTSDIQTSWWWYTGVSSSTLTQSLNEHGARLIDLEIDQASPLRLSASMVRNTGAYASAWWWYFGITANRLSEVLDDHGARILDLEVYVTPAGLRYAVILVPNTGAEAKAWWWLSNVSFGDLSTFASRNGARVVDLEVIERAGTRTYAAVMIRNSGTDQAAWWWYTGITLDGLSSELAANGARLLDLERRSDGTLAAIAVRPSGERWWWYVGLTMTGVSDRVAISGARIVDIERYEISGQSRYAVVLTENAENAATAVGRLLDRGTDGAFGYYLKPFGMEPLTAFHESQAFYPASTIKVLELLSTLTLVSVPLELSTTIATIYFDPDETCQDTHPASHTGSDRTLRWTLEQMMQPSSNPASNALQEYAGGGSAAAGRALMNGLAQGSVGMSPASRLNHKFACGGPTNDPANTLTLEDLGRLYERVISGQVLPVEMVGEFHEIMLNEKNAFPSSLRTVIEEEAAALGKADRVEAFIDEMLFAQKGGNIGTSYLSIGGWIELPFGLSATSAESTTSTSTSLGSSSRSSSSSTSVSGSTASETARVSERLRHRDRPATAGLPGLPLAADAYDRRAYTFGLFIDDATTLDLDGDGLDLSLFTLMAELLRDEVRAALASW